MRNIVIGILCLIISPVYAQRIVEKQMDCSQKEAVSFNIQIADSIIVHTWDKKEVSLKASIDVNNNQDNDTYKVEFDESGSTIRVTAKFDDAFMRRNNNLKSKIYWNIYLPEGKNLKVKTIDGNVTVSGNTGALDLNTISGNVIITGKSAAIEANAISGFIDLAVLPDTRASLDFKTISGSIYSNHEVSGLGESKPGSNKLSSQLNGGGMPIKLKTISGDIYFRKI